MPLVTSLVEPPIYVGGFTLLDEKRPARTTGRMRWPQDGPGSRVNLIRCAAAILNAKYERERAAWAVSHPFVARDELS